MATAFLNYLDLTTYASASALTAVDTSSLANGSYAEVTSLGVFQLNKHSTQTANGTTVIAGDAANVNWEITYNPHAQESSVAQFDPSQIPSMTTTDYQQFVGIQSIMLASVGTWTKTRVAEANYVYRHTAANETAILGIDITPELRAATSKGFKLTSFDVLYSIGTANLDAHTLTLDKVSYANNAAVTVTAVTLSGSLATATQANPYVSTITVSSPAFNNSDDSKYVIEVTVDAAATSAYDFIGIVLNYTTAEF